MDKAQLALNTLTTLLTSITNGLISLIGALFLILIGWIIAKIVRTAVKKVLEVIKIDSLAEKFNEIDFIQSTNFKLIPSQIIPSILYYTILVVFFITAFETMGMQIVSELLADFLNYIPKVFSAIILFVVGVVISNFIKNMVTTACESFGVPSARIIGGFVFYFLLMTISISALNQAGVNTDILTSNISLLLGGLVIAFGISYGLASRDVLSNIVSAFYSKNKIVVGDIVRINNLQGEVLEMDGSSLTLKSEEGKIIIPLSKLTTENIEILENKTQEK